MFSIARVPTEVWSRIFEFVVDSGGEEYHYPGGEEAPYAAHSLVLVCKAWRDLASPLLLRNLHLTTGSQIRRLHSHVLLRDMRGETRVIQGIRTITSELYPSRKTTTKDEGQLASVIQLARSLRHISIMTEIPSSGRNPFGSAALLPAVLSSGATLRYLQLYLACPPSTAYGMLSRCTNLEQLHIQFGPVRPNANQPLVPDITLSLPRLWTISVGSTDRSAIASSVSILEQAQLPKLQECFLDLNGFVPADRGVSLLSSLGSNLETLRIEGGQGAIAYSKLGDLCPRLGDLEVCPAGWSYSIAGDNDNDEMDDEILELAHPALHTLLLKINVYQADSRSAVEDVLRSLDTSRLPALRWIRPAPDCDGMFKYSDLVVEEEVVLQAYRDAGLAALWCLRLSNHLERKGIKLLDFHGNGFGLNVDEFIA